MKLVVLGLNHRSAAVEVRERFSFDKDEVVAALTASMNLTVSQNALYYPPVIERKFMLL